MGKKRITTFGDQDREEELRQKKALKRQQKKLREGKDVSKAEKRAADMVKKTKSTFDVDNAKSGFDPESEMRAEMARLKAERTKEQEVEIKQITKDKTAKPPRQRSTKYQNRKSQTNRMEPIAPQAAIDKVYKLNYAVFTATVELHINLRKKDLVNTMQVDLPHTAGKAKKAVALNDKVLKQIADKNVDFDILYASPDQMKDLVPHAKFLGPRGMMPNPKTGTLVPDPEKAAANASGSNQITIKTENKAPVIHTTIARTDMKPSQALENLTKILKSIEPQHIQSVYIATTMSPSVRVDVSAL